MALLFCNATLVQADEVDDYVKSQMQKRQIPGLQLAVVLNGNIIKAQTFASKIDYELFLEQGRDFKKNYDEKRLDRFWADVMNSGLSHPSPSGASPK